MRSVAMSFLWVQAGVWLLVGLTGALVVLVAALVWRDGFVRGWRAARETPPQCPHCGYNLSGLTQARCPECGRAYRLEELWQTAIIRNRAGTWSPLAPPESPEGTKSP